MHNIIITYDEMNHLMAYLLNKIGIKTSTDLSVQKSSLIE